MQYSEINRPHHAGSGKNLLKTVALTAALSLAAATTLAQKKHSTHKHNKPKQVVTEQTSSVRGQIVIPKLKITKDANKPHLLHISNHGLRHTLSKSTPIMNTALGLQGHTSIPETITTDMMANLKELWHKKMLRVRKDKRKKFGTSGKTSYSAKEAEQKWKELQNEKPTDDLRADNPAGYYYVTKVKPYIDHKKAVTSMDIKDFIEINEDVVSDIKTHLNRSAIQTEYDIGNPEIALLKKIVSTISGKDLTSYSLTELMEDSQNGEFNMRLMDFYLRVGGKEFVQSFPAIYDGWTSHGPYQFTSNALFDKGNHQEGASRMNACVMIDHCIPGSMIDMEFEDHSRAAFLFAIHNMALLVRKLSGPEVATLSQHISEGRVQNVFIQFIAMAHNSPGNAIKGCQSRISGKTRGHKRNNCNGNMHSSVANHSVSNYGKKTSVNLAPLQKKIVVQE